MRAVW